MLKAKGFLFDLDGTLVDSLPAVERAYSNWAESKGLNVDEVLDFIHGKQSITTIRHFMPNASDEEHQAELKRMEQIESSDVSGVRALPGVVSILNQLNDQRIPWAIVTSGTIPVAYARHAACQLSRPDIFITAELVKRGKPQPDPYLLGAEKLGLKPEECVVVEDALAGVMSGLAAGCQVLAVNAPLPEDVARDVHLSVASLEDITCELRDGLIYVSERI